MFYDLNVPVAAYEIAGTSQSKKSKGKQPQQSTELFTPAQIAAIEARVDILVHLGYNVLAFNQTVNKIDPKIHVNVLDSLLSQLRARAGVVFLKRLTIILDEESEKGFGLTSTNASTVESYDLLSLVPTTAATFSQACLTHSLPSPLTAHVISLPLTSPRLPFHFKHTLVRTAIKNGAVFEINYVGALGETGVSAFGVSDSGLSAKRNWWASAREVIRVTKGKGIIVSGGALAEADCRGPRDVQNLISLLGLAQNLAHDASSVTPKSLIIRAQTRKTYRAVLSEPRLVVPTSQNLDPAAKHLDPKESLQAVQLPSGDHTTGEDASKNKNKGSHTHGRKKRGREYDTAILDHVGRNKQPCNHPLSDSRPSKKKKGKHVTST